MNSKDLELFETIFNLTPIPIQIWEKMEDRFKLININEATKSWGDTNLNDKSPQEFYETTSEIIKDFNKFITQKLEYPTEIEIISKNIRKEKRNTLTCKFIPPNFIVVFIEGKNLRKKSEISLKKAEREKSLILSSIAEHVIFQDTNHNIIWANQAAADSIHIKVDDLIGKKCFSLWCNPDGITPIKECPIQISLENKIEAEAEITTSDGRSWKIKGYPVIDEKDNLIGAVEVTNEITQLRSAQRHLNKSEKRYREAYNRSRFYKDLFAHDINNIFQNILSSAELLSLSFEKDLNEDHNNTLIDIIIQQLKRGTKLASNVRKLSELEDSEIRLYKIDILKILERSKELVINAFPRKNIQIKLTSDFKMLFIYANDLVNEMFDNIIFNSVHHNINPIIEIEINVSKEIEKDKRFIKLEILDNGIGIPDLNKQKVFIRGEHETETISGSGLGLKLVKKLVDIYKGEIWIEDRIKGDHSFGSNCILLFPEAI